MVVNPFKPKPVRSLLGLALHEGILHAVTARGNGAIEHSRTVSTPLRQDLLEGEAEAIGREIREFLDREEIRENRCLLAVPVHLTMALPVEVPDLSREDLQSYLELQAESEFPFGNENLSLDSVSWTGPEGTRQATLIAIPRTVREHLEQVMHHARLRLVSLTPGLLPAAPPEETGLTLRVGDSRIDCHVSCGGGYALIRSLENAPDLCRELRITLGQLSPAIRKRLSTLVIHHHPDLSPDRIRTLKEGLSPLGLSLRPVGAEQPVLRSVLTRFLVDQASPIEFLPPRKNPLEWILEKSRSRRNAWIGGGASALVLITLFSFLAQGWWLGSLERRWAGMEQEVGNLETMQNRIRQFRPWIESNPRSLQLLHRLATNFPREGRTWVRTLTIDDGQRVLLNSSARSTDDYEELTDTLTGEVDIRNFSYPDQVRQREGRPVEFDLKFDWTPPRRP